MSDSKNENVKEITPQGLEELLGQLKPTEVSSASFDRMLDALENPEMFDQEEDKVISFAEASKPAPSVFENYSGVDALKDQAVVAMETVQSKMRWGVSVAAAVVLAFTLALFTNERSSADDAFRLAALPSNLPQPQFAESSNFTPASTNLVVPASHTNRTMLSGIDKGIVWDENQQPHMCVKVKKIQLIPVQAADGSVSLKKEPVVEYFYVPCEVD